MLSLLLVLLGVLLAFEDAPDRTPVVTGIFPPGVTFQAKAQWTISGRNLDQVSEILSSESWLKFRSIHADPSGQALTVEVEALPLAANGYSEIRVGGPTGTSNLAIVRVDYFRQVLEVEPNDQAPAAAQVIAVATAVAGTIHPLDVDRYRVEGLPGQKVTLDWETRRLGTAIMPVMTITGPGRAAIAQARSMPGGDRDVRHAVVFPPEGWFEVELRDNTYGGGDRCRYRLRVDPYPFASGVFPLAGARGHSLDFAFCGGSLVGPIRTSILLQPVAGSWLDPDALVSKGSGSWIPTPPHLNHSLGSRLLPPSRIWIDDEDRPRFEEPADSAVVDPRPIPAVGRDGLSVDGRIDQVGQVDRYRIEVKAGDRFRGRVEAAPAGSRLDSVLRILGPRGDLLGENDDRPSITPLEPPSTIDGSPSTDSQVDVTIQEDGPITVELADRFGLGGPEFGYVLELGPPRADFAIHLLRAGNSADPEPEARCLDGPQGVTDQSRPTGLGSYGVFNVRRGSTVSIPFVLIPRGWLPGRIRVEAAGLPAGIEAEPIDIRMGTPPRPGSRTPASWDAPPEIHALRLRIATDALLGSGRLRIKARTTTEARPSLQREADCVVGVDSAGGPTRPVIRLLNRFPIRVIETP